MTHPTLRVFLPALLVGLLLTSVLAQGQDATPMSGERSEGLEGKTSQIENLTDVLYLGRPVQSQENTTIGLYRIEADGKHASRVAVDLGRSSVDTIEIVEGLDEGDRVILSDTSRWDDNERIRLR